MEERISSTLKYYLLTLVLIYSVISINAYAENIAIFKQKVSGDLAADADVLAFEISLDNNYLVFLVRDSVGTRLYSIDIISDGALPVQLNPNLASTDVKNSFTISPDSKIVIYQTLFQPAPISGSSATEIYSVPITGGVAIKLNQSLASGGNVSSDFKVSSDSRHVVYRAEQEVNSVTELYAVSLNGENNHKLNLPLAQSGSLFLGDVDSFKLTADGKYVVYLADQDTNGVYDLYSTKLDELVVRKLNNAPAGSAGIARPLGGSLFGISPDSHHVLYMDDELTSGKNELFSVSIEGGVNVRVNQELPSGVHVTGIDFDVDFPISPDGSRVVYRVSPTHATPTTLYSAALTGNNHVQVSKPSLRGGWPRDSFKISSDSARVVYHGNIDSNAFEVFSAPLNGGSSVKLNDEFVNGGNSFLGRISEDGKFVVYFADQDVDGVFEIFSVPIQGGNVTKLNGDVGQPHRISRYEITSNSQFAVYQADQDTSGIQELYLNRISGGETIKISNALVSGGNVRQFQSANNGEVIAYIADQEIVNKLELFISNVRITTQKALCFPIKNLNEKFSVVCL